MITTHRTTISVPLELKARMDANGLDVNWSAIACEAWGRFLDGEAPVEGSQPRAGISLSMMMRDASGWHCGVTYNTADNRVDFEGDIYPHDLRFVTWIVNAVKDYGKHNTVPEM